MKALINTPQIDQDHSELKAVWQKLLAPFIGSNTKPASTDVQVQTKSVAAPRVFDYTIDPAPQINNPWDKPNYIPFDDPLVENRRQREF